MSVLCVLTILDILTLPLTAIVGIFWVKQYELPMMGEGFSTKINGKKLGQLALLLLSGAALGALLALALDTAFSRMMDTNDLPQMRRI